jgi:hypothetical protein
MPSQVAPVYAQGSYYWYPLYKYTRYDFYGSGVNTWAKAPAQNPDQFEQLLNVFSGYDIIRRRWGYGQFTSAPHAISLLFPNQNSDQASRAIIGTAATTVDVFAEDGSGVIANNLIPTPINVYAATADTLAGTGPNTTGTGADGGGGTSSWTNPNNVTSGSVYATTALTSSTSIGVSSNHLNATNYSFALPSNFVVGAVEVKFEGKLTAVNANNCFFTVSLIHNGTVLTGTAFPTDATSLNASNQTFTFRMLVDPLQLANANWLYSDINNSTSGVSIQANIQKAGVAATSTFNVRNVRLRVFSAAISGSTDMVSPALNGTADLSRVNAITGTDGNAQGTLGTVAFQTGPFATVTTSGGFITGGTIAAGGSVIITGNGTGGVTNGPIFVGAFTGIGNLSLTTGSPINHTYTFTQAVSDGTTTGTLTFVLQTASGQLSPTTFTAAWQTAPATFGSWNASPLLSITLQPGRATAPRVVNSRNYSYLTSDVTGSAQYKWNGNHNFLATSDKPNVNASGFWNQRHLSNGATSNPWGVIVGNNAANDGALYQDITTSSASTSVGESAFTTAIANNTVTFSVDLRLTAPATTPVNTAISIYPSGGFVSQIATQAIVISDNTNWTRFSVTGLVPSTVTNGIRVVIGENIQNTISLDVRRAQLEVNTTASAYQIVSTGSTNTTTHVQNQNLTLWGIVAPNLAPSGYVASGGGNVTTTNGRTYFFAWGNSFTQNVTAPSPAYVDGPVTGKSIAFNTVWPSPDDSQVDTLYLLATADGGDQTLLYQVATQTDRTVPTITDNLTEAQLAGKPVMGQIDSSGQVFGCFFNSPPPNGTSAIKHGNRLAMIVGQSVAFSKSIDEVTTSTGNVAGNFEECWPASWTIDMSDRTETPRALLSDGAVLYIGTERGIKTVTGDSIFNYSVPQVLFNDTGVMSQDVWQRVFFEGQPVGSIWLTPDLKVMQSDFNTYLDIGQPIQDQLLTINRATVKNNARVMAVADGEFDLFLLAVPTGNNLDCDTVFCYNLRTKTWAVWQFPEAVTAMLYNITLNGTIQKLFASSLTSSAYQNLWQMDRTFVQDRVSVAAQNITSVVRTPWLHLSDPRFRKQLNDIEVLTAETSTMLVTVEAGSTISDFSNPITVISNAPLTQGVLGQAWKVFLAGLPTKNKFYRFTFTTTGTQLQVVNGIVVEFIQLQI